jgi:hypothetical protein
VHFDLGLRRAETQTEREPTHARVLIVRYSIPHFELVVYTFLPQRPLLRPTSAAKGGSRPAAALRMQDFPSYLLRHYFHSTDWHPSNSYLNLTSHSSSILLDFPIPNGLALSLSSSPTSAFFSTHRLRALPSLGGCAGYVVARTEKPLAFGGTGLREVLERFRIVQISRRDANESSGDKPNSPRGR